MNKDERFEAVYNEYYSRVLHYVRKHIEVYQEAEDLTQDIFVACYRKFDSFDPDKASVGTWVYVIMRNRLKNYYRDKKDIISTDDEENPLELSGEDYVEQAILLEEQNRALMEAIRQLSEREQQIVVDRYFRKRTSEEIAVSLRMSAGNVRVVLNRALSKMRIYLGKQWQ